MSRTRIKDHIKYYVDKALDFLQIFIFKVLNAFSFLMIAFYFGYIVYFSTMFYDIGRVIVGCISLYLMIHLNKSLS